MKYILVNVCCYHAQSVSAYVYRRLPIVRESGDDTDESALGPSFVMRSLVNHTFTLTRRTP